MPVDVNPGEIISVEDFMDNVVHYLTPPVAEYQDKITIIFNTGLRISVLRDQIMGLSDYGGWQKRAGDLRVGETIPSQYIGQGWTGNGPSPMSTPQTITQIIDPSDNTIYNGVDKHVFEGRMPIPGELISVPDITDFLIRTGNIMYTWTTVYVYEWTNYSYENRDPWPMWRNPGGNGWELRRQWQYQKLGDPITTEGGLYSKIPEDQKIKEDQLISIYQLQRILSQMYVTNDNLGTATVHHLTCHNNCHGRCHCKRW